MTATLNPADVRWPSQLPPGWTKTSYTTATYTVTFDDVSCSAVLPDSLLRVPAVCTADGAVIASLVDLPTTPGITYSVAIDPANATNATVTATVGQGYGWGDPMTEGWTTTGPTTATHSVDVGQAVDCVVSSPPVPPTAEIEAVPPSEWVATVDDSTSGGSGTGSGSTGAGGPFPVTGVQDLALQLTLVASRSGSALHSLRSVVGGAQTPSLDSQLVRL